MNLENDLAAGQVRPVSSADYQSPALSPRAAEHVRERKVKQNAPASPHRQVQTPAPESSWVQGRKIVYAKLLEIGRPITAIELSRMLAGRVDCRDSRLSKILYELKRRGLAARDGFCWTGMTPPDAEERLKARPTGWALNPSAPRSELKKELDDLRSAAELRQDEAAIAALRAVIEFFESGGRPAIAAELRKFLPAEAPPCA